MTWVGLWGLAASDTNAGNSDEISTSAYVAFSLMILGLVVVWVVYRRWNNRRWARWRTTLRAFAELSKGEFIQGNRHDDDSVVIAVRGHRITVRTTHERDRDRNDPMNAERWYMTIDATSKRTDLVYLGPPREKGTLQRVKEAVSSGGKSVSERLELGGVALEADGVDKGLRQRLESAELKALFVELFQEGGHIDRGVVTARSRTYIYEPKRLATRVQEVTRMADML